jgi:threonine dehydrogenase-like Zn-dependent dehydrogenase
VPGGQAEYVRVPKGTSGRLKSRSFFLMIKALFLSDICHGLAGGKKCAD